jgi:hypothetical protein
MSSSDRFCLHKWATRTDGWKLSRVAYQNQPMNPSDRWIIHHEFSRQTMTLAMWIGRKESLSAVSGW